MSEAVNRRSLLSMGLALPLLGGVTACGSGRTSGTRPRPGGKTQVTFWSSLRGSHEVVQVFNDTHDDIEVVFNQIPTGGEGGYAILRNASRAGNAPDVVTLEYPQVPEFVVDGIAQDISSMMSPDFHDQLLPAALARTTYGDGIYAVPNDLEPLVMHYRDDIFTDRGYGIPGTWDEFAELGRRIRDERDGRRIAIFPTNGGTYFAGYSQQAGGRWFDTRDDAWHVHMADEETRRVAQFWQSMIDEDIVRIMPDGQEFDALLSSDQILTRLSGAWDAGAQMGARPGQTGLWRIAPLPQWSQGEASLGDHGGSTFALTGDSREPEAALEFIRWQVSHPDSMAARLSAGTSSMFPVVEELVEVAREAFDESYYGGQDIYSLFAQEAPKVRDDWNWGPRMTSTLQVMQDNFARVPAGEDTLLDAVRASQAGTVPDLRALGLSVSEVTG
ncbi:ABC transporter substrate-binding protein [Nesterenkonia sp. HG001]|uniref:ABC transporter substrate-binding protein n=1 Tax=Nesterenkonia sp. HG001 TaxID=2983207 RepID=UPI002AC69B56|nr:extracellular solute-binding protein [Nesterenkonia sp. HG001]MDZ5077018.1 extracellular solute-binding protein [Nesterenkonia sp. HG001]